MTLSCPSSEPRTILCLIAAVVALVAVSSMTVRAQTGTAMLDALSGVWEGRGTMRRSPTAAAEPVSCRYEGTLADAADLATTVRDTISLPLGNGSSRSFQWISRWLPS